MKFSGWKGQVGRKPSPRPRLTPFVPLPISSKNTAIASSIYLTPTLKSPTMRLLSIPLLLSLPLLVLSAEVTTEYTHTVECERKTQRGDAIEVHYRGTLASDGSEFDASYKRGTPLGFTVGKGMVIKG